MKYSNFKTDDFIKDEYFQKWVLDSDTMTDKFWNNWLSLNPDKKEEVDKAKRVVRLLANDKHKLSEIDFDAMWQNIIERRGKTEKHILKGNRSIKTVWKQAIKVAAVFIGLVTISYGVYQSGVFQAGNEFPIITTPQITLELQDGTIKTIDDTASGVITTVKGQKIGNQQKNVLVYNHQNQTNTKTLVYNKLTVPYGKKFELVLSDGSHILLNSGSKLRYPVKFIKGKPRDVFLDGEAFFTVAKDKASPFTVVTDEMNTKVYGTEFNVTSYKNEHNTSTVLIKGSVGVYRANNDKGDQPITIVPGQQAVFENGKIDVKKVDIGKHIAWTEGKLFFVNDRFELILKELERHFNIQISNQFTQLNNKKFTGTFTDESLEQILNIFQEHTPFQYLKRGNILTIKP